MSNVLTTYKGLLDKRREDYALIMGGDKSKAERLVRFAMNALEQNSYLGECDQNSFFLACSNAAMSGLEPDPNLGQIYFVPRKGRVYCQVGYKGFLSLAYRSGKVISVFAELVRKDDEFAYELGTSGFLRHVPKLGSKEPVVAAYARAVLAGGVQEFTVVPIAEIDAIRDKHSESAQRGKGPWATHYAEMAKKTVIRRLLKLLPVGEDLQRAIGIDELSEHEPKQNTATNVKDALRGLKQAEGQVIEKPEPEANAEQADFLEDLSYTGKIPG